ncbi:MAG: hypothetical protein WC548_00870 [Candidatus Pacearchaeota archaeon]
MKKRIIAIIIGILAILFLLASVIYFSGITGNAITGSVTNSMKTVKTCQEITIKNDSNSTEEKINVSQNISR